MPLRWLVRNVTFNQFGRPKDFECGFPPLPIGQQLWLIGFPPNLIIRIERKPGIPPNHDGEVPKQMTLPLRDLDRPNLHQRSQICLTFLHLRSDSLLSTILVRKGALSPPIAAYVASFLSFLWADFVTDGRWIKRSKWGYASEYFFKQSISLRVAYFLNSQIPSSFLYYSVFIQISTVITIDSRNLPWSFYILSFLSMR